MTAMRELDIDTVRYPRSPATHFVKWIDEPWSKHVGSATTYCGRRADVNAVEPRKFSQVRSWCLTCYDARRKAIRREAAPRHGHSDGPQRECRLCRMTQGTEP